MQELKAYLAMLQSLKLRELKSKEVPLLKALNRILDCNIKANINIPSFNSSAMDGYAIMLGAKSYLIKGEIYAGDNANITLKNNEAYKIMTGAKVPKNAQAIIPKELVEVQDNKLVLKTKPFLNQCIKFAGEDFKKGQILLKKGQILDSNAIAMLASQGISKVSVRKKVKIIIFGSGNELASVDSKLKNMQIYDINSYFIKSAFSRLNCNITYSGILSDDIDSLSSAIKNATKKYDIIITSGGVSVGDKDYIHSVLDNLKANILANGINIKPGRPVVLSQLKNSIILSLPGNPIGAFIQARICLPLLIQKFSGVKLNLGARVASNASNFKVNKNTSHIIFGNLVDNKFQAFNNAKYQGSQVAPLLKSNTMAIFSNKELVKKNEKIMVLDFEPYFLHNLDKIADILNL